MTNRSALSRSLGLAAALLWVVSPGSVSAQEGTGRIQGTITAEGTSQRLNGVQVQVRGTGIGGVTNEQGMYALVGVPAGERVIVVQLIGYDSGERVVTVRSGETVTADFTLAQTAVALDEIVVTGTAAQVRRKEIGNSIATIGTAQLENMPIVNASDALAGRAAGVTFMANSGQPGAGSTIKIRGINSVSQDAQPLIYVDGVRIANQPTRAGWGGRAFLSPLQDIAPEDIARVEIVKGAAATTLYGTEASNGVIQIFTKRGIAGDAIWTAGLTAGVNSGARWGTDADPTSQYVNCGNADLLYGFDIDNGQREYFDDPTCPADGDWMRNGAITNFNLSVRGGTGNVTYFASGNFGRDDGILPTQRSTDGGFRANVAFSPTSQLSFTLNNSYQKRDTRFVADGNNAEGFLLNVGRGANNYLKGGKGDECDAVTAAGRICTTNGYSFDSDNMARSDHFTTGLTTTYTPMSNFTHRFTVGYDYTFINTETTLPFNYLTLPEGYYWDENTRHTKVSLDYTGSLQNTLGESIVSTFSWGGQLFRDRRRWTEIDVQSFAGPGEPTLESGAELTYRADDVISNTNAGVFVQEQIGIQDRLFVIAGLRVDGNSAFGDDFGLQPYPKVSVSYVLSDYSWWPGNLWETFKLRFAVGESGKAPNAFDKVRTWTPVSGDDGEPGFSPLDIGNDEVGPERTREFEAGFDASFFDGRLGAEFTGFHARTIDALVPVVYPPSQGFLASRNENVGELVNKGFEFGLTGGIVRTENFDWQVRFNGTVFDSKVVDLDGGKPDTTRIYTGLNSYLIEGQPGPVYVQDRVMNPNDLAGPIVRDTIIGLVYPNKLLGFGTTLTLFNRLTLDALAEFQGGHHVQNYTAYQSARRGAWHPCFEVQEKLWAFTEEGDAAALNDVTALERARCGFIGMSRVAGETVGQSIGFWTEKGDFLKMRHISLTYEIPERFIRFAESASITLSARNLFTRTDYTGADPEMTDAADASGNQPGGGEFGRRDYYQIPPARAFLMALRFTF
ncbi:MAG TPA: SusC/RagA family TonB-linked outer membrane protein [Longimicrobiales bacterium]